MKKLGKVNIQSKTIFAISFALFASLLWVNLKMILTDRPLDNRENAQLFTTRALSEGKNVFDEEMQPTYSNAYGVLNNALLAPVCWATGACGFATHRIFDMICNLATMTLLALVMLRLGVAWEFALPLSLIFFCEGLSNRALFVIRPDSLALLLFVVALIALPILGRFSLQSLMLASIASLLGWMTKPYIALAAPMIMLFSFFRLKLRQWLTLGVFAVTLFVAVITAYAFLFPYYFHNTTFANSKVEMSFDYLLLMLSNYYRSHIALLAIFAAAVSWHVFNFSRTKFDKDEKYFFALQGCCLAIFLWLAQNTGSDTYHTTWITPFFLIGLGVLYRQVARDSLAFLVIPIVCFMHISVNYPASPLPTDDLWGQVANTARTNHPVLHGSLTAHMADFSKGDEVFDTGYGNVLYMGTLHERNPIRERAKTHLARVTESYNNKFRSKAYNLVMIMEGPYLESFDKNILAENYSLEQTVPIDAGMYEVVRLQFWKKRP